MLNVLRCSIGFWLIAVCIPLANAGNTPGESRCVFLPYAPIQVNLSLLSCTIDEAQLRASETATNAHPVLQAPAVPVCSPSQHHASTHIGHKSKLKTLVNAVRLVRLARQSTASLQHAQATSDGGILLVILIVVLLLLLLGYFLEFAAFLLYILLIILLVFLILWLLALL
jgi:hypothetical protein